MKRVLLALCALLAGCDRPFMGTSEPIKMRVIEVYEDKAKWGCIGTDIKTLVRSDDGRTAQICDKWGKPGDVIAGCWVTGAADPIYNGFRKVC